MGALLLIGVGWIVGLGGVTAAATATFLEGWGRRPARRRGTSWVVLGLVLLPACELRCEVRRGDPLDAGDLAGTRLRAGEAAGRV